MGEKKPNIVFFFTDDQRFDTIRALNNAHIYTPNMDKLVKMGTSFTQAHIPGGTRGAICMPSRAMLHTGRTLFHLEEEGQNIPEAHTTIGEYLQEHGYVSFGTGKWHNGTSSYARSFNDGGEIFFGGMHDHWNVPASNFDPSGKYDQHHCVIPNFKYSNETQTFFSDHIHHGKHSTELFSECTINWLKKYKSESPYFVYLSFMAPHDPRSMPKNFIDMYTENDIVLPPNFEEEHLFNFGAELSRDEKLIDNPKNPSEVKRHILEYYAMISHLDHEIGKVMKAVEERGEIEHTLFILAGDNGLALGQHGLFGKQNCYEHSLRVPLIFAGPRIPKNQQRDNYVYLLDIFPTLCEYLNLPKAETIEGQSMLSLIDDPQKQIRKYLYLAYSNCVRGIKNERYKLIEYVTESLYETQLFDLHSDPWEMKNLVNNKDFTGIVKEMRNKLFELRDELDDTLHSTGIKFWNLYENKIRS